MLTQAVSRREAASDPAPTHSSGANEIRMFAFADDLGGQSGSDDVSRGFFTDYQGEPPIPAQTGGAAYEGSYCEEYPPIG